MALKDKLSGTGKLLSLISMGLGIALSFISFIVYWVINGKFISWDEMKVLLGISIGLVILGMPVTLAKLLELFFGGKKGAEEKVKETVEEIKEKNSEEIKGELND
jgi:hypothetical protein